MSAVSVLLAPSDEAFGAQLEGALARSGLSARLIAGDQADLFVDGAQGLDASIVVWSAATMRLVQLHEQARAALEQGALIPVSIEGATAPVGFESLPPIDLSDWRGDDDNPRWRFVLEALAIASTYRRDGDQEQAPPTAALPAAPADEIIGLPAIIEKPAIAQPYVSTPFLASDTVDGRLPRVLLKRSAPRRSQPTKPAARPTQPTSKPVRFDPGAIAVAGVMTLCLATGAAIILAPSFLHPAGPGAAPTSEAPPPSPIPDTQRVELAMAPPEIATPAPDDDAPSFPEDRYLYEPDELEEFGQGDISYPADDEGPFIAERGIDSHADEIHLAMLGPIGPPDEGAQPVIEALAQGLAPKAPSIKPPAPIAAPTPAGLDTLMVSVAELATTMSAGAPFKDCDACPDMIALTKGAFTMGPGADQRPRPNEGPARRVEIARPFSIAAREVTFAEWDACVADGGCAGHKALDFGWGRGDQPVVGVSFADAQNYAAWLTEKTGQPYRLPSEAEWEFAARGGQSTPFSFGVDLTAKNANFDGRFAYRGKKSRWVGRPTPASRYPANAFGLFDMHGNVWEWTADCWRTSLEGAPVDGSPRGGTCVSRTLKGGAFNTGGWRLRAAHRIGKPASTREMEIGFRVVRVLD